MAKSKQRNRPALPSGKPGSRGGGRPAPRRRQREFPWLPVSVAAIFAVVLVVLFVILKGSPQPVAAVSCQTAEQTAVHYHAHLAIYNAGRPIEVPASIGIQPTCFYWLHTHDNTGIIHIEAPPDQANRTFTLGEFFDVWGQPLDSTHVAGASVGSGQKLVAYVNGRQYNGNPRSIGLKAHENITLEIQPPPVTPSPYQFPAGV